MFDFLHVDKNFDIEDKSVRHKGKAPRFKFLQELAHRKNPLLQNSLEDEPGSTSFITEIGRRIKWLVNDINCKPEYPPMDSEFRKKLKKYYKGHNKELTKLRQKHNL